MSDELLALTNARNLIEHGWTQHCMARNAKGMPVVQSSKKATCWCLTGALLKAVENFVDRKFTKNLYIYLDSFIKEYKDKDSSPLTSLITWNDSSGRSQEEVLNLLDEAIVKING